MQRPCQHIASYVWNGFNDEQRDQLHNAEFAQCIAEFAVLARHFPLATQLKYPLLRSNISKSPKYETRVDLLAWTNNCWAQGCDRAYSVSAGEPTFNVWILLAQYLLISYCKAIMACKALFVQTLSIFNNLTNVTQQFRVICWNLEHGKKYNVSTFFCLKEF